MKSHELLRSVFAKQCVKQIAAGVKLADVTVYKWTEPTGLNGSGQRNPLDVVALLMALTHDQRLIEWLCAQAGGRFVALPVAVRMSQTEMLLLVNLTMQHVVALQSGLRARLGGE